MSFGFSPGDLILCIQLALKVWRGCRDAPKEFRAVSTEAASLHLVLREIQDSIENRELEKDKKKALGSLLDGCQDSLKELQDLLYRYNSLGTQSKRTWDRLRWGEGRLASIRQKIIANTTLLTSFHVGFVGSGVVRIEKLLQQLVLEHQMGLRENSVISVDSIESAEEGNDDIWYQIRRELEDVGITPSMVAEHRSYIITWIKNALNAGQFKERAPCGDSSVEKALPALPSPKESHSLRKNRWSLRVKISSLTSNSGLGSENHRASRDRYSSNMFPEGHTLRPGDVTLSQMEIQRYLCAHRLCENARDRPFTTWFELLLHARTAHSLPGTPKSVGFGKRKPVGFWGMEENESSVELLESSRYVDRQHRQEMSFLIAKLEKAAEDCFVPQEVPSLMYDLYYSRKCPFADCSQVSENTEKHRAHFLDHFVIDESPLSPPSEKKTHKMESLRRVWKLYACGQPECLDHGVFSDIVSLREHCVSLHPIQPIDKYEGRSFNCTNHPIIYSGRTLDSIASDILTLPSADSAPERILNQDDQQLYRNTVTANLAPYQDILPSSAYKCTDPECTKPTNTDSTAYDILSNMGDAHSRNVRVLSAEDFWTRGSNFSDFETILKERITYFKSPFSAHL